LLINTKKAAEKGLKDGDMVFVENMFGSRVGPIPVKTTGIVQEEVAGFASGLSRKAFGMNPITSNGISFNPLLSSRGEVMDIVTDAFDNSPRVKVYKA
jgi:anaerobic selenocysteine-containing dehydrogenase